MAKIAIIGAGQAGLLAAHALKRRHDISLYSDRSPEDFLTRARPTGTAGRFQMALDYERELGLERWGQAAPPIEGVHLTFSTTRGNQLLTLLGKPVRPGLAIDVRLQSATWMRSLAEEGGKVEIESVGIGRLEEISAAHDLTIVAAGRAELMKLFPRDEARSAYREPQRQLAMVNVVGPSHTLEYAPWFRPVKFNLFADRGECFWVPWYSKDNKPAWSLLFEAKPGGPLDRFRELKSAEAVLKQAKELIRVETPWDADWVESAEPCDENSWLVGAVTPEVRQPVGRLPSGRVVMALGDTAHSLDPIAGQGANNGNKMARNLVACIDERTDGPFDADWMVATHERFWARHGAIHSFNNAFLEPLTNPGKMMLMAQYGSTARPDDDSPQQKMADRICENFNDPAVLTPAFFDAKKARQVIGETFGGTALWPIARGAAGVARGQIRQALGRPAGHPGMA